MVIRRLIDDVRQESQGTVKFVDDIVIHSREQGEKKLEELETCASERGNEGQSQQDRIHVHK